MTTDNSPMLSFEIATAISTGARDYQEDALLSDMSDGAEMGLVILSDGMGGHAAGDVASKIVVTEMFNELTFRRAKMTASPDTMTAALRRAAYSANLRIGHHSEAYPKTMGMGATLLCTAILHDKLHWLSVGDSPLFLLRGGKLRQLNEDHSMAPQIDLMVEAGIIPAHVARSHPDRNVLTSVLCGDAIPYIDCPPEPLTLKLDDIVIIASDGLQFLAEDQIAEVLTAYRDGTSHDMSDALMTALADLNDPGQDNVSLALIQVKAARAGADWQRPTATQLPQPGPLMLVDPVLPEAANCRGTPDSTDSTCPDDPEHTERAPDGLVPASAAK